MKFRHLTLIVFGLFSISTSAQQPLQNWIQSQIFQQDQVTQNGKGVERQRESPSSDPRSTSLVDQSSATDFFSIAANLIPVTPGLSQLVSSSGSTSSDSSAAGSTTATVSLYALMVALNRVSPTDPDFYRTHVFSRRFFLTVGTAASKQATDNTDTPAVVYGAKILLINGRELYNRKNKKILEDLANDTQPTVISANLTLEIIDLIFTALHPDEVDAHGKPIPLQEAAFVQSNLNDENTFQHTLASIPSETMKKIRARIQGAAPTFREEVKRLQNAYDSISKAMQMSLSYTANIRDSKGNNDHRAELIFDYGISPSINWTVNASGDYTDRKTAQRSAGGRFATSFQGDLTKSGPGDLKTPMRLTFSGEGKWLTKQKPQYTFEAGLSIPFTAGIDVPLVYRYANRIAQINRKDSEARLGFSIDIAHLAQAFGRK